MKIVCRKILQTQGRHSSGKDIESVCASTLRMFSMLLIPVTDSQSTIEQVPSSPQDSKSNSCPTNPFHGSIQAPSYPRRLVAQTTSHLKLRSAYFGFEGIPEGLLEGLRERRSVYRPANQCFAIVGGADLDASSEVVKDCGQHLCEVLSVASVGDRIGEGWF
jgi:hypothetical protein